jgi:DNA-binding transcriptional MerR regulator
MLIGEVAECTGVAAKTLRYYEEVGLLEPPARSHAGHRLYDESVVDRLAVIRSAQATGLSLGEIRRIVSLRDRGETPCGHVLDLLRARSQNIARTIRELRRLKRDLDDPEDCDPRRVCHLIGDGARA